jgi:hypothetical protein
LGPCLDRGSEYVPVVRVRKLQPFDERLVVDYQAVRDRPVDQLAEAAELLRRRIRMPAYAGLECLVENLFGPLGLHEAGSGDPDAEVAQRVGVQHIGVIDDDEWHRSVLAEFLAQIGKLVEDDTGIRLAAILLPLTCRLAVRAPTTASGPGRYRVVAPHVPFGGFGANGIGRENGADAIGEYT